MIGSVCDASHADEHCERTGDAYRSQGGRMTILATRSLVDQAECGFHLIACTSNTLKRVCRSTLTAETYQMELGVEAADQLRAAIADMFGPSSRKQWEIEATSAIQLVWVTDCDSSRSALASPTMGKPTDKRLGITIASLRQAIWRRRGEVIGAPMVTDTLPSSSDATDICRWVDTDCMLADALTKQMSPEKLVAAMDTNTWKLEQPIESIVRKRDKQRERAAGRNQRAAAIWKVVMAMAREPWAMQIETTEPRMGKRGGPSTGRARNFDSSTCAAGDQEAPRFEVVSLTLRVTHG